MYIKIQQQNQQYIANIQQLTEERTLLLEKLARGPEIVPASEKILEVLEERQGSEGS